MLDTLRVHSIFSSSTRCYCKIDLATRLSLPSIPAFIPKSGKKTFGLDRFFDTRVRKARQGSRGVGACTVDVATRNAYTLSARQTPRFPEDENCAPQKRATFDRITSSNLSIYPQAYAIWLLTALMRAQEFIEAVRLKERHLVTRLQMRRQPALSLSGPLAPSQRDAGNATMAKSISSDVSRMDLSAYHGRQ